MTSPFTWSSMRNITLKNFLQQHVSVSFAFFSNWDDRFSFFFDMTSANTIHMFVTLSRVLDVYKMCDVVSISNILLHCSLPYRSVAPLTHVILESTYVCYRCLSKKGWFVLFNKASPNYRKTSVHANGVIIRKFDPRQPAPAARLYRIRVISGSSAGITLPEIYTAKPY